MMEGLSVVGKPGIERFDAHVKATREAIFTDDIIMRLMLALQIDLDNMRGGVVLFCHQ